MTRRKMLWILIVSSAVSAMTLYVAQGILATGKRPDALGSTFLLIDTVLWGMRAIVEAAVIVYLFETRASSKLQSIALTVAQVVLIAMITLTLGPALRAMGLGVTLRESLSPTWYTVWTFGMAAYTSLMMGATGLAYRCQPYDVVPTQAEALPQLETANPGGHGASGWRWLRPRKRRFSLPRQIHVQEIRARLAEIKAQVVKSAPESRSEPRNQKIMARLSKLRAQADQALTASRRPRPDARQPSQASDMVPAGQQLVEREDGTKGTAD